MIAWLEIGISPTLGFYRLSRPTTTLPDLSYPKLVSIGAINRALEVDGGADAANLSIDLDNGDGALTSLFGDLLKQSATVYYLDGATTKTLVSGTVDAYQIGAAVRVQLVG